jgi:transposase
MRRAYLTDLSDAEWRYLKDQLPTPKAPGRPRVHTLREILITPSSTSCVAGVLGAYFRTTSHRGPPSTTTSELGGWMEHGKGCTPLFATEYELVTRETLSLAQG